MNVHPQVLFNLARLDPARAKRAMKFWFTHGERDALYRLAIQMHPHAGPKIQKWDIFNPFRLDRNWKYTIISVYEQEH